MNSTAEQLASLYQRRELLMKELVPYRTKIDALDKSREFYIEAAIAARREHAASVGHASSLEAVIKAERALAAPLEASYVEMQAEIARLELGTL